MLDDYMILLLLLVGHFGFAMSTKWRSPLRQKIRLGVLTLLAFPITGIAGWLYAVGTILLSMWQAVLWLLGMPNQIDRALLLRNINFWRRIRSDNRRRLQGQRT